jgi:quercetin dioxygenase-like cupin family protein
MLSLLAVSMASVALAQESPAQTITRADAQEPVDGPQAYFTGHARIEPLYGANEHISTSGAYVTFDAGARSAWHTHPKGQYLVVTSGVGRTQQWGKPAQETQRGDVIWCPPGIKHWHGAAPNMEMTHLAITATEDGKNVDWLEKVSDDQYLGH